MLVATFLLAYLLGSIPFGLVITRGLGLGDLRAIGSGNIGATNVLRTGNKSAAARLLGLTRRTLGYRLDKHGLAAPESEGESS